MTITNLSSQIYRGDHILGLAEKEFDAGFFRSWGAALGNMIPKKSKLIVTCDNRIHSDKYKEALISGLIDREIHVVDVGQRPFNLAAYTTDQMEADGYACVGGGLRSPYWNGLRWSLNACSLSYSRQCRQLRFEAETDFLSPTKAESWKSKPPLLDHCRKLDITNDWLAWLQSIWYDTPRVPLRVLIDPLHGAWSSLACRTLRAVFPQMVFESIHDCSDEYFGGLIPDIRYPKTVAELSQAVHQIGADLGIIFGGDTESFTIVDSNGVSLGADEIGWFVLHDLLGDSLENEIFLHDDNCSEKVIAEGRRLGGKPLVVSRREGAFVREMRRTDALIGVGSEGEIYFRGAYGNRIVLFAVCWFLDYLSVKKTSLLEWRATVPLFYTSSEIRTPLVPLEEVVSRLRDYWMTEPQDTVDGICFSVREGKIRIRMLTEYFQLGFHFESSDRLCLHRLVYQCSQRLSDLDSIGLYLNEQFQLERSTRYLEDDELSKDEC